MLDLTTLSRADLENHSVDIRQFMDFRQTSLPNGMRIVEAYNGSGLTFTLLPDRGMDIWSAHYKGLPLTWLSQGSPHPPDFGQTFLQQFNGGLLTTCGLTHAGPPETDGQSGAFRDLHGRFSRLRAGDIQVLPFWVKDKVNEREYFTLELSAAVAEGVLFGEQLRLERTYFMTLGRPEIDLFDNVTNVGDTPAPLMLLYHFNVGFPLVSQGVRLHTPSAAVYPREAVARAGLERWAEYDAPAPAYAEQVFFHHVKTAHNGVAEAALLHDDFGLSFAWDTHNLPYLTQWKNTRQGVYVSGVEPGNCIPEGQNAARRSGRLVMIEPGRENARRFHCRLTVLEGREAVEACRARIADAGANGQPIAGCYLDDFAG